MRRVHVYERRQWSLTLLLKKVEIITSVLAEKLFCHVLSKLNNNSQHNKLWNTNVYSKYIYRTIGGELLIVNEFIHIQNNLQIVSLPTMTTTWFSWSIHTFRRRTSMGAVSHCQFGLLWLWIVSIRALVMIFTPYHSCCWRWSKYQRIYLPFLLFIGCLTWLGCIRLIYIILTTLSRDLRILVGNPLLSLVISLEWQWVPYWSIMLFSFFDVSLVPSTGSVFGSDFQQFQE